MSNATNIKEVERLKALSEYHILDTLPEQSFDDITKLAARLSQFPISYIAFFDESRQWFKSKLGITLNQMTRADVFCAQLLSHAGSPLFVEDASLHPNFSDSPLLGDTRIRCYAGVPLLSHGGEMLGALCVLDTQPHELDEGLRAALQSLARLAMLLLEHKRNEAVLAQLSAEVGEQKMADPVTKMPNRRALERSLVAEWERAFRYSQPLSILMLDVDEFKSYCDKFGREAGDGALRQLAELIGREARQPDFIARYSVDQFVVLLPETDSEGALKIAERLRYKIEQGRWPHRAITVSVGYASYGVQADAEALLAQVEHAMANAKQSGRNCVMAIT